MKTTTVPKQRNLNTFPGEQNFNNEVATSQYNDSSRYSWYYEENIDEQSQERVISISRFASVEVESGNPITLRMFKDDGSVGTLS